MWNLAGFIICATIIFFAGRKLSYYGDLIAEKTGMGKAWIGFILMATVTSLPELMVGISSSAIVESADLAVGDILGSCAFNLGILALMDAFVPDHKPIFSKASQSHVLAATMGIMLISIAGIGLFLPVDISILPGVGVISVLFIIIYLISIRMIYLFEMRRKSGIMVIVEIKKGPISLRKVLISYVGFALIIITTALFLPPFAEGIAEETGLGKTFVGTLMLAASTSLPEIAVSIAAVRMGSVDMAVGNLLGSNIFNIVILAIDDVFYTKGNLLKDASEWNLISVLATILMASIAIIGLTYRAEKKRWFLAWDAMLIFAVYIGNILLLYKFS